MKNQFSKRSTKEEKEMDKKAICSGEETEDATEDIAHLGDIHVLND